MTLPAIQVEIENPQVVYLAGDTMAVRYSLLCDEMPEVEKVEASVLWRTTGRGDEDKGVHYFDAQSPEEGWDPGALHRFSTRLPATPLSYPGVLLQINWCVRVRMFIRGGKDVVGEARFQLGNVPRAVGAEGDGTRQ